jgi:hypothetical protein
MNLNLENLTTHTTEELEGVRKPLSKKLRRRKAEKKEMENLEKLAAKHGFKFAKEPSVIQEIVKPEGEEAERETYSGSRTWQQRVYIEYPL